MQLRVCGLQVTELYRFSQQLLVKRQREAPVNVVTVKHRQAHHATHKVEIRQVVLKDGGTDAETEHLVRDQIWSGHKCEAGGGVLTGLMEESGLICNV